MTSQPGITKDTAFRRLNSTLLSVSAALLLATAMVLSACGDDSSGNEIELVMHDSYFEPSEVTLAVGEEVTFKLPNDGKLKHNMRIGALNGSFRTTWASVPPLSDPGTTGTLKWTPPEPGRYRFRCDLHETTMVGVITVE